MPETVSDNQLYHFSKKVLFFSFLFLAINIAWFGLSLVDGKMVPFREVAPKLIFAEAQDVMLKSPFDADYLSADPGQTLLTRSMIKTGEQSFAEIQIEGNVVRLDQNTEVQFLENNFSNPNLPRFVFRLQAGSLWVNAFDPIEVLTQRAKARLAHTVGLYTYNKPLNRVFSVMGNVDLTLFDEEGEELTSFVLPLKNQTMFVDSQILPEYARLEYSKLKKEVKLTPISSSILEEDWVKRNTTEEAIRYFDQSDHIYSANYYRFKDRYHHWKLKLSLIPAQKRVQQLSLVKLKLGYLLGKVHADGNKELARTLLDELDVLFETLGNDPIVREIVESQFYAIRNVHHGSPAYLLKENFREKLYARYKDPELFRTYLADLDYSLRTDDREKAEKLVDVWLEKWKTGLRETHQEEFDQQVRIFHHLVLAYIDQVGPKFLSTLDDIGDYRLENADDPDKALLEIALERLELSKYLVAAERYTDAKTYIKTSYAQLNLDESEAAAAARDLFIKEAALIADRIAFAEQSMRGAAEEMDNEEGFKDYLSAQERDKTLAERFSEILEEEEVPIEEPVYPTIREVAQLFAQARIVVLEEDIEADPESRFDFVIKSARLIDRAKDGSSISFSAKYNFSTNGVYEVVLNEEEFGGSFVLEDFVEIAKGGKVTSEEPHAPQAEIENLADFLNLDDTEEALRSQVIAQDLALQLLIKELDSFDISVPSTQNILVLNPATLTEFKVQNVFITDVEKRKVQVTFDYNSSSKIISNVVLKGEVSIALPSRIPADTFINTVFSSIYGKELEVKSIQNTVDEAAVLGLLLNPKDFRFLDAEKNQVEFDTVRVKELPINFSGILDRKAQRLVQAEHELLAAEDISVKEYLKELSGLWVVDYLAQQKITITQANIETELPAEKIQIRNYARGDKILHFVYEAPNNRLTNVQVEGVDSKVDMMTFEEFKLIGGGEQPVPIEEPVEETIEEPVEETIEEPIEEEEEAESSGPKLPSAE
jgi:hypothetical protein